MNAVCVFFFHSFACQFASNIDGIHVFLKNSQNEHAFHFLLLKYNKIHRNYWLFLFAQWSNQEEKKQYKSTTLEIVSSVEQSGICINRKFKLFYENNKLICSKCCCLLLSSKNNTAFLYFKSKHKSDANYILKFI